MDRETIIACFRSLDFRVSVSGMITKDKLQYGYLGVKELQLPDGSVVPCEDIDSISQPDYDMNVTLQMEDGTERVFSGGKMKKADIMVTGPRAMPKTTMELNAVFDELYPNPEHFFYDVLRERDMINMTALDRPDEGVKPLSDKILALYHEHMEAKLKEMGFQGRVPSRAIMDEVLQIRIYDKSRNFFREWFESHEWDGVPRLRTWFQDTFGATAPALSPEEEQQYLGDVAEAWFVGAVSRQYISTHHEVVPVLIGDQGIGKGLALKYTAGKDEWFKDTSVDISKPDRFLDSVRGRIIVEFSESSQIKSSDMKLLKGFISQDEDQLRKAYARNEETFPRHFVLIATSNVDNIFTDVTGNRRFFPMYCDPLKATRRFSLDRKIGQYDVEQVWAEALYMFNNKGRYFVPKSSQAISKKMQQFCTVETPNVSSITDWLDSHPIYSQKGAKVSRQVIFEKFFGVDSNGLASREEEYAYKMWTTSDKAWRKVPSLRIDGKVARGYVRIYAPNESTEISGLKIVDSDTPDDDTAVADDPVALMRELCIRYNCKRMGDVFPHHELSPEALEALFEAGYIYESKVGVYNLAVLP